MRTADPILTGNSDRRSRPAVAGRPADAPPAPPQIVILAADVLVTDYSSTMFDFAVTGRPIINFTYDLDYFSGELRGFYFDLAEAAPGPLLATSDEVLAAIAELSSRPWVPTPEYTRFRETFCSLEDGHATERVLDLFFPPQHANDRPRR